MYQNNKQLIHPEDKGEETAYCPLPTEESHNQDVCLDDYSSSQLAGNSLPTAQGKSVPPQEIFESEHRLEEAASENEPSVQNQNPTEDVVDNQMLKGHTCQECGKFYLELKSLKRHARSHRSIKPDGNQSANQNDSQRQTTAEVAPFQCQQCPRQFQRRSHYHYHVKVYHGPRSFKCQTCDKAFTTKGALTTHERIHSGEKPYACETCGRRFNVNSNLLAHVPKCTGALPFKCDHCGKGFAAKSHYLTHVKVVHYS